MSKFFKSKSKVILPTVEPRSLEEITKAYSELCCRVGQAQYQVHVHQEDVKRLNEQLVQINNEAAARQKLDKEAKEKEVQNEQS